jgi:sulfonate transport system permease protein
MGVSFEELSARAGQVNGTEDSLVAGPSAGAKGKAETSKYGILLTLFSLVWSHWKAASLGLIVPTILVAVWELLVRVGLIDRSLFSSPTQIVSELSKLIADGALFRHLESTFSRVIAGFAIGVPTATLMGALTGFSKLSRALLDPLLQSLRSIPSMAWVPLFILWLGINENSKVCLISLGVFFPVYLNLMNGVQNVDRKLVEVGLAAGFHGVALVRTIILPASLPAYLVGLRQGLALGWMFVVAAEIMGASRGLGYLLIDGETTGRPAIMICAVVLFAVCGKLTDSVLCGLSKRWLRWQDVYKG